MLNCELHGSQTFSCISAMNPLISTPILPTGAPQGCVLGPLLDFCSTGNRCPTHPFRRCKMWSDSNFVESASRQRSPSRVSALLKKLKLFLTPSSSSGFYHGRRSAGSAAVGEGGSMSQRGGHYKRLNVEHIQQHFDKKLHNRALQNVQMANSCEHFAPSRGHHCTHYFITLNI